MNKEDNHKSFHTQIDPDIMAPRPNMIDTQSPEWQVDPAIKPDKERDWSFPADHDGWVLAHDSIRGEMALFLSAWECIQKRGTLKDWELPLVQKIVARHLEHVHGHHSIEDDIMVPELSKRFHYPKKLEIDHIGLTEKLDGLERVSKNLQVGSKVDDLVAAWEEYQILMLPHLQEEEDEALPLYRAYYTEAEDGLLEKKIMERASKLGTGSFIHFAGVDKIRNQFMPEHKIPGFVWYIDFRAKYNLYLKEIVAPVEALKSGQELVPSGCFLL